MSTKHRLHEVVAKASAAIASASLYLYRVPALKMDAEALLFSAKSFAAAMIAYYISLCIGLPKPYWAIVTVYIVSQTTAGASLSRGLYRFAGTVVGAIATIIIVPNFVNYPIVCSVALAFWIGFCLYFSLLDRTPRAYAFVLSGYTTSLIGFPGVLDPGTIFNTASVRVQEILIGVLCAVLIHRFVLPRRTTGQFLDKLSSTLWDARRLVSDALQGMPRQVTRHDRDKLANDLLALQGLTAHLPYDPTPLTNSHEKLLLIHDRLAQLLPLVAEIEEKVHAFRNGNRNVPRELAALLSSVASWIDIRNVVGRETVSIQLISWAHSLRSHFSEDVPTIDDILAANLVRHLADMIEILQECDRLVQTFESASELGAVASSNYQSSVSGYVYHRDFYMAARAALGAIIGIVAGCVIWIESGWSDGATAVSILGVSCALFGNVDAPAPNVVKYMAGSIYGVAISLVYSFAILPTVTDFTVLVAVLAPAFLFAGSMQARPSSTFMALGITLTIPILAGLDITYNANFAEFLNTTVALFTATGFAVISMGLFQTVPVDVTINRLVKLNRRDVSRRARGLGPIEVHWTNLMIDRTALLYPRLFLSNHTNADLIDDTVRYLRIGRTVSQLRKATPHNDSYFTDKVNELLLAFTTHFSVQGRAGTTEFISLVGRVDTLIAQTAESSIAARSRLLSILIDLRFSLSTCDKSDRERES